MHQCDPLFLHAGILMKLLNITLALMIAFIAGCGSKSDELRSFSSGESVAWRLIDGNIKNQSVLNDQDCQKQFESSNGIINLYAINNDKFESFMLWGGATDQLKKNNTPIHIPETGEKTSFLINKVNIESGKLKVNVTRDDGANMSFDFRHNNGKKMSIVYELYSYINPTAKQSRDYELTKQFIKPSEMILCSSSSFKNYMNSLSNSRTTNTMHIYSALEYVLDKKWSMGNINCNYNGGSYEIYSRKYPMGHMMYFNGEPATTDSPQEFEFQEKGPTNFTYIGRMGVGVNKIFKIQDPNQLAAEDVVEITLTSPERIDYVKTIKMLNFDAAVAGQIKYDIKKETGYSILCN